MVKNAAKKNAARKYQAEHPGMSYPEALRRSQEEQRARKAEKVAEK